MVYKQAKSKYWWYKFTWNGEQIRESTKQTNKRIAEQMEAARKTALAKGEVGIRDRRPAPSFPALCDRFVKWMSIEKAERRATVKFYNDMVRSLRRYAPLNRLTVDKIDNDLIEKFIEWRRGCGRVLVLRQSGGECRRVITETPVSLVTINRELATLRRMLNLAHEEWGLLATPPPRIRLLPGEKNRERVLSYSEEEVYLALAPDPLHDFALICLDSGLRPGEIQRIRWENVHFEPVSDAQCGYIHNPEGGPKKRKRNLPMTARVREALISRFNAAGEPSEGWVFPGETEEGFADYARLDSQHDRILERMKICPSFRLYDLRHTALTRLGESGADVFTIQQIAGHTDIKTTSRYVHPTPEHIQRAVARLERYNSEKAGERAHGMKVQ